MTCVCPKCGSLYTERLRPLKCDKCGEMGFNFTVEYESHICEWCGMIYPVGGWKYYSVTVFSAMHMICSDCYDQLKVVDE